VTPEHPELFQNSFRLVLGRGFKITSANAIHVVAPTKFTYQVRNLFVLPCTAAGRFEIIQTRDLLTRVGSMDSEVRCPEHDIIVCFC
jgi:hypothetical protein